MSGYLDRPALLAGVLTAGQQPVGTALLGTQGWALPLAAGGTAVDVIACMVAVVSRPELNGIVVHVLLHFLPSGGAMKRSQTLLA